MHFRETVFSIKKLNFRIEILLKKHKRRLYVQWRTNQKSLLISRILLRNRLLHRCGCELKLWCLLRNLRLYGHEREQVRLVAQARADIHHGLISGSHLGHDFCFEWRRFRSEHFYAFGTSSNHCVRWLKPKLILVFVKVAVAYVLEKKGDFHLSKST